MNAVQDTRLASPLATESGGAQVDEDQVRAAPIGLLGLIDVTDRHGNLHARLPVTRWPVTVGRALDCDLVLDDVHVAGQHLRLTPAAAGHVTVQVMDTRNGVALGHRQHVRGDMFDWPLADPLILGRLHLSLRLADSPVPVEQSLPRLLWRNSFWSIGSVLLVLLLMTAQVWLKIGETQNLLQELPVVLGGALAVLGVWSGLWALATKLFSGQARFWRHVRIASMAFVAADLMEFVTQVLAFAFSWENVSRFGYLALVLAAAVGIYRHLLVAAPHSRRGLAVGVALVVLLGLPTMWGTQWLKNQRLSNQLYMAQMFPPSWRIAKPESVPQFLDDASGIEKRLAKRLKDKQDENGAEQSADDEE
jgi:hypothetical protein